MKEQNPSPNVIIEFGWSIDEDTELLFVSFLCYYLSFSYENKIFLHFVQISYTCCYIEICL